MALKKTVTAKNGIVTEYHRIAMISVEVNQQNTILLYSYLSEDGRQVEKDYAAGKYNDMDSGLVPFPYYDAQYLHPDYDGIMTVEKAYEYLKSLPEFEGAEDV
jgi:hypothetical protein